MLIKKTGEERIPICEELFSSNVTSYFEYTAIKALS